MSLPSGFPVRPVAVPAVVAAPESPARTPAEPGRGLPYSTP